MNVLLMRYGFPIAVISRDDRLRYYDALEFSQPSDLSAFIALLCECTHESLEEYKQAAAEQMAQEEWAKSLGDRLGTPGRARAANEYELWRSAQDLFRGYMRQTADMIDESSSFGNVYFKDFGMLELEKYLALKSGDSAKRTWFSA
jgi:Fic family protein